MKRKITAISCTAVCLLLTVGVMTLFSACGQKDDGTWMKCHSAQMSVFYVGAVMTVLSAAAVFINKKAVFIIIKIITAVLAVTALLLPETIMPMCMMHTMRCYTTMKPFVLVVGAIAAVLCVTDIIAAIKVRDGRALR